MVVPEGSLSKRGRGIAGIILRVEILNFEKHRFLAKNICKFPWQSVAILKNVRQSTTTRLHASGTPESHLSNRSSGIAGIILKVEILKFEKNRFLAKNICKFSWQSVVILKNVKESTITTRLYENGTPESYPSNHSSGIAEIILKVQILKFEKNRFLAKNIRK